MIRHLPKKVLKKIYYEEHPDYVSMSDEELTSGQNLYHKLIVCRDNRDNTYWALLAKTDVYGYVYFPMPLTSVIQKQVTVWQWRLEDEPEKAPRDM